MSSETTVLNQQKEDVHEAVKIIRNYLTSDREQPDLAQLINAVSIQSGTCSGTRDEDYPLIRLPQLSDTRHKPLPPEVVEQFGHMQCNCIMGIFSEIGRAWLTVDSDIFVWRYVDGEDLAYFDGLSETILSAALVRPKPGIFRDNIKFLLVLTTPLEVTILGVSFAQEDVNSEMHLLPDPLFSISSDNVYLYHTVATESGRIFTGGKDGCLYEIAYQAGGGWFSRKCTKINHSRSKLSFLLPNMVNMWLTEDDAISQIVVDDTRNILYTRTEKGTLTVFDLGTDGQATTCVAQMKIDTIKQKAAALAASKFKQQSSFKIIHFAPITRKESRFLHLVAITQSGIRLYFMTSTPTFNTTTGIPTNINGSPIHSLNPAEKRPNTLNLVHVRLPPGFTPNSTQGPMEVHAALHNSGTLLLAASTGDDDTLWCVSGDSFPSENLLSEAQVSVPIDGRAWVIKEVPEPPSPLQVACLPPGATIPPDPPIQVIQHFQRPSEYVVVTSQGCYMFNRLRPIDQLRFLLEMTHDPEGESVASFFKLYKNGEAACTCIILAASGLPGDRVVSEKAVAAFFRHGGEPYYTQQGLGTDPATLGQNPTNSPMSNVGGPLSPIGAGPRQIDTTVLRTPGGLPVISTPMPGASVPAFQLSSPGPGSNFHVPASSAPAAAATPELCYSDKMKGLFKMFSRIVRPLWEGNLVSEYAVVQDNRQQILNVSRIDPEVVSHILEDLNSLKLFMESQVIPRLPLVGMDSGYRGSSLSMPQHRLDVSGLHGTVLRQSSIRAQQAQAALVEAKMTQALYNLLEHTTQVIGLWRFICNHDIHLLCQCLPKEVLSVLKNMMFYDFVLDGQQVCSQLISVIVNQYIDNKSEVEGLNKKLRQICPSLYSLDDVICSRASELLSSARQSTGEVHKMELKESLELFQQVAHCVNLPLVSQQYQAVGFYEGVVELCATAAIKKDPRNLALQYYKSTASPAENIEGSNAYHIRAECYKSVTDMMDALMQASESLPQAPSVPVELGPPKPTSLGTTKSTQNLKPEEAQRYAESCLQLALHSEDELFHEAVYDWMLRRNLKDKLLRISSPFLEMYLKRITASRPDDPFSCDILWQYYERSGDHLAAAKILSILADKVGNDRDLTRRIEYLSRSKMNGKSATTGRAGGEGGQLLHELEEKLEVAQLQSQIQQALKDNREDEAASSLNFQLMDITKLYSEYAEPFELAECKLAIVHCAGHYDPPLIDALWQNVIEQEFSKLQNQSPENQVGTLSVKITQLGQRYSNAQRYFPVEFLIKFLERLTCEQGWPDHWVFSSLLNSGVQITHLLDAYQDLHRQKLMDWEHLGSPYHLLRVIHKIIGAFAENPANYISTSQRRQFISYALDIIAALLVELQSTVEVTDQLLDTRTRFKNLQSQMERLQSQAAMKY